MTIDELTTLISNVGFPIACCVGMFWMLNKTQENNREQVDKLAESVNNNTAVIKELITKLDVKGYANTK